MPVFLTECDSYALKKVAIFSLIFAVTISVCGMLILVTDILQFWEMVGTWECGDKWCDLTEVMMIRGRPLVVPSRVYTPRQPDETPEDYRKLGLGKCFEGKGILRASCHTNYITNDLLLCFACLFPRVRISVAVCEWELESDNLVNTDSFPDLNENWYKQPGGFPSASASLATSIDKCQLFGAIHCKTNLAKAFSCTVRAVQRAVLSTAGHSVWWQMAMSGSDGSIHL